MILFFMDLLVFFRRVALAAYTEIGAFEAHPSLALYTICVARAAAYFVDSLVLFNC